ncbi:MAG: ankyrin repeat domain-containing protein [Saprospiraceae bacterium]
MNILKIVTILNWIVIAVLGFLVIAETLSPTKGGDAAGRGIGMAIYYLAIFALVVLVGLNLLPYKWAKYTAFVLIVLPILYIKIWPKWRDMQRKMQQEAQYRIEDAKPIFDDEARDQIARAIRNGELEKLKKLLEKPVERLNEGGELLYYAISEAASASYRPAEKIECIRMLFEAGAKLDSTKGEDVPPHMFVADVGNAVLIRLLLEQGADANASQINIERPILFEAIGSYQEPEATVRTLLEFGANPNASAVLDDEDGAVSPLWQAAKLERWGVCVALIEKGADINFKTSNGKTFRALVQESERDFPSSGYTTQSDYERLKSVLK